MDDGRLTFPKRESVTPVTYHDSCRLGIHLEVIDSPRRLFEAAGLKVVEMENTKNRSYCCGNCAWTNCSSTTMKMQLERMRQAKRTGAEYLLTSDPKCQIHLSCAMSGKLPIERELVDVPVKDMAIALAEILKGKT
jgi:Fe-S oxidoreductase